MRVFEARYMDMVRGCLRSGTPFGVCRIIEGSEVGKPARHEAVGCLARISDWDMAQVGVLQIVAHGEQRFRVIERQVQADGLVTAQIEAIDDDPPEDVPPEYAACADLLRGIVDDLAKRIPEPGEHPIAEPYEFESCTWVSNRLCELLPIPVAARQKLMELPDSRARLSLVHQFLVQRKVL